MKNPQTVTCSQEVADSLNEFFNPELTYFCDTKRHLVCKPYSITNLHIMAKQLDIKRCWFHKNHYDIPFKRIEEITEKCELVSSKEIVKIIKGL